MTQQFHSNLVRAISGAISGTDEESNVSVRRALGIAICLSDPRVTPEPGRATVIAPDGTRYDSTDAVVVDVDTCYALVDAADAPSDDTDPTGWDLIISADRDDGNDVIYSGTVANWDTATRYTQEVALYGGGDA